MANSSQFAWDFPGLSTEKSSDQGNPSGSGRPGHPKPEDIQTFASGSFQQARDSTNSQAEECEAPKEAHREEGIQ